MQSFAVRFAGGLFALTVFGEHCLVFFVFRIHGLKIGCRSGDRTRDGDVMSVLFYR